MANELEGTYGLASVPGGGHPAWGTANRIVPLGTSYVELIAVVDEDEVADSAVGRWVAEGAARSGSPIGWAVRPPDLDETARRLGLTPRSDTRGRGDGSVVRRRTAGLDEATQEPGLPFFIEWAAGAPLPGSLPVGIATTTISRLDAGCDPDRLSRWLGDHPLPVGADGGGAASSGSC